MQKKINDFVQNCVHCNIYVDKKTSEPIKHHKLPAKNWDTVAVDLFGPMPSLNHIVVVTDIASRYPAAKLVRSTKSDQVISALEEIYNTYGNLSHKYQIMAFQPFNSSKMAQFAAQRDIELRNTPSLHPSAETFMQPLGKGMKIGANCNIPEKETLQQVIHMSYRQTPHPFTGRPPNLNPFS